MESTKAEASHIKMAIEDMKASKREIQFQHANLGGQISTLETRISTLESLLGDYAGRISGVIWNGAAQPPAAAASAVDLTVVGQDGSTLVFRMKKCNPMRELMSFWCVHQNQQLTDDVFLFKGQFLMADKTPQELEMEDGDEIRVENRWV